MLFNRRFFIFLLSLVFLSGVGYGLGRLYFHLTDGFGPDSIASGFSYERAWDIGDLDNEKQAQVTALLDRSYRYMAKGTQAYVLLSDDGLYVIKFFKQKHLEQPTWKENLADIPLIGGGARASLERRSAKRRKIFTGCKIGYDSMQEDSGVVYVHLNPSENLNRDLLFFDKMGYAHHINPNEVAFYIQKKGVPVHRALLAFKEAGDTEGAALALAGLLNYLVERSERGIEDSDPNILNNLGFLDGQPATLDLGGLYRDKREKNVDELKSAVIQRTQVIQRWIELNYSELLPRYAEVIQRFQATI